MSAPSSLLNLYRLLEEIILGSFFKVFFSMVVRPLSHIGSMLRKGSVNSLYLNEQLEGFSGEANPWGNSTLVQTLSQSPQIVSFPARRRGAALF